MKKKKQILYFIFALVLIVLFFNNNNFPKTTSFCNNVADTNNDCSISLGEVITYANKWVNNQGVTLSEVISVANIWTNGGDEITLKYDAYFQNEPIVYNKIDAIMNNLPGDKQSNYDLLYSSLLKEETQQTESASYNYHQQLAHSIYLDANDIVPWKLRDYSDSELDVLFKHYSVSGVYTCDTNSVSDITLPLLASTQQQTVYNLVDSVRRYRHKTNSDPEHPSCLAELWSYDYVGGCHDASRMMASMAVNLNIPAYYKYNSAQENWYIYGHGSVIFEGVGYISHGDNIYDNTALKEIPSSVLIIPWSILQNQIVPLQSSPDYVFGSGQNPVVQRYMFDSIVSYPPDYGCWVDESGYHCGGGCDYTAETYGSGVATQAEIDALALSMNCGNPLRT